MVADKPEKVGQMIALADASAADGKILSPPRAFRKLYIQEAADAKSGKWARSKGQPGEESEENYLVCCDCCRYASSVLVHAQRACPLSTDLQAHYLSMEIASPRGLCPRPRKTPSTSVTARLVSAARNILHLPAPSCSANLQPRLNSWKRFQGAAGVSPSKASCA